MFFTWCISYKNPKITIHGLKDDPSTPCLNIKVDDTEFSFIMKPEHLVALDDAIYEYQMSEERRNELEFEARMDEAVRKGRM